MKYLYLSVFLLIFKSCSDKDAKLPIEVPEVVDSFSVFGLDIVSVFFANSFDTLGQELVAFHPAKHTLDFFLKDNEGNYQPTHSIPVPVGRGGRLLSFDGSLFTFQERKEYIKFDTTDRTAKRYSAGDEKPVLKDQFQFLNEKTSPSITRNDTIIFRYSNNSFENIMEYRKDSCFALYSISGDTLAKIADWGSKPEKSKFAYNAAPIYIYKDGKIQMVFSNIDTLYTFDLNTWSRSQRPINNDYFIEPVAYDIDRRFEQKYKSLYLKNNFLYWSIYFNELTNHYILFFEAPYLDEAPSNFASTYALVMDEQFEKIAYYNLGEDMGHTGNILPLQNKGFAIPLRVTDDDSKITYRVYNF